MFFEGPEKKFELAVKGRNLRELPKEFWEEVLKLSGAKILSEIRGQACDAFLLSESSLFVFEDHMVMITCGRTTLVDAAIHCVETFGLDCIESLIFERKNELFPHYQRSSFFEDVEKLKAFIPGRAFRFGREDEHHILLFHYDKSYKPDADDRTLEILMHGIQDEALDVFSCSKRSRASVEDLGVRKVLPGFEIDDHVFEPCGYSLNAVKEKYYYTIHVTPEAIGSYVSFETNLVDPERYIETIQQVVSIFRPRSFDVVMFSPERWGQVKVPGYRFLTETRASLSCGYEALFTSFFSVDEVFHTAYEFKEI